MGDVRETPNSSRFPGESTRMARAGAAARASHEPAYLHIANTIAAEIGEGIYRPGDQLPTEPQLRTRFGVSPVTVRRAINLLLDRGLVTTTQGKGTFVRSPDLGGAVFHLHEITDMWADDDSVDVRLLEVRIARAGAQVAQTLEIPLDDPVVCMRRLILRQGVPLVYQVEYVIYDEHRPLIESQLQSTSLDGVLLAERGEGVPSGRLTIEATGLDAEAARYLKVPEGSPASAPAAPVPRFRRPPGQLGDLPLPRRPVPPEHPHRRAGRRRARLAWRTSRRRWPR